MKRYLVLLLPLLVFMACDPADYFNEYRDVNLIDGNGFDSGEWGPDRDESYYMNFEEVSSSIAGSTGDLPDDSGIYRLEIPNLVPKGDFEEWTIGADVIGATAVNGWTRDGGPPTTTADIIDTSAGINGNTMEFDIGDEEHRLDFDLSSTLLDGFKNGKTYIIRFDIKSNTNNAFEVRENSIPYPGKSWTLQSSGGLQTSEFPPDSIVSTVTSQGSSGQYFSIGAEDNDVQTIQGGWFDNFRVVRTDIDQWIRYDVPVTDPDGDRPNLIDGYYKFTVYIKEDPTNTKIDSGDKAANRLPASGVTLQMALRNDGETYKTTVAEAFHPDDEDADWSEWTKISVTSGDSFNVTQFDDPDKTFIQLRITPTDTSSGSDERDAGSVLIASPILEYLPDGPS
jgi:hypothetical protein